MRAAPALLAEGLLAWAPSDDERACAAALVVASFLATVNRLLTETGIPVYQAKGPGSG